MPTPEPEVKVVHNPEEDRYELSVDGQLAGIAEYRRRPGRLVFTHTEVSKAHGGRGLGRRLVGDALDDVRRQGVKVTPLCSFVAAYMKRNPSYADLLAG